jgi:hypothetical protein
MSKVLEICLFDIIYLLTACPKACLLGGVVCLTRAKLLGNFVMVMEISPNPKKALGDLNNYPFLTIVIHDP